MKDNIQIGSTRLKLSRISAVSKSDMGWFGLFGNAKGEPDYRLDLVCDGQKLNFVWHDLKGRDERDEIHRRISKSLT